jgi:hypothetical protein
MFHVPNKYRDRVHPQLGSDDTYGNNGFFWIKHEKSDNLEYRVQASDGMGWEHVSIHIQDNDQEETPVWEEMCQIKDMFWDSEDCVIQFHPPKSEYVNHHENTLHLWRPVGIELPRPDSIMVGIKKKNKPWTGIVKSNNKMGTFKIEIIAVGGHGVDRGPKEGESINPYKEGSNTPDALAKSFVEMLKYSGTNVESAKLIHWPGETSEVTDDLLNGKREKGNF